MRKDIAKIKSTFLGVEDHGIFTCFLHVDYGSGGQGVGGYSLDEPVWMADGQLVVGDRPPSRLDPTFKGRKGTAYGMEFVRRVIKACGVDSWEKVTGRTIYVLQDLPEGSSVLGTSKVLGIENLPTEPGEQFLFADLRKEFFEEADT